MFNGIRFFPAKFPGARRVRKFFLCILLIFSAVPLLSACSASSPAGKSPGAEKGVLDLTRWDFEKNGTVNLDGEWEFHWLKLLAPSDLADKNINPSCYARVPGIWSGCVSREKISCNGYGTYRLTVKMGSNRGVYALKVDDISHAYRLWINGAFVLSNGTVAKSGDEMVYRNFPRVAVFHSGGDSMEIVVQASNFNDVICGIARSIRIGTVSQIVKSRDSSVAFNLFLFGSLLIMGLYHLSFYIMRRKDPSALYFGIFCLIIAARSLLTEERFLYAMLPGLSWEIGLRLEFLTLLAAFIFTLFLRALYGNEFSGKVLAVVKYASLAYAVAVIATPLFVSIRVLPFYQATIGIAGLYAVAVLIRAVINGREGAALILAGFIFLFSSVINDILHSHLIIQTAYLVPFGIFIFIFLQSFVLARRFSRSFSSVEDLSEKLKKYAGRLEDMVEERTRELATEKEKLRARHEIMEKDLKMARTIQQQLMPDRSPTGYIHCLYRPMDLIGGDYYDFIRFRDSDKIGIFISDVSGHGVPAALIASMVKSLILRAGDHRNDPARMLAYLNKSLLGQTGGNFVTAFYGIYDPGSRTIVYANAGHHPPYVVADGTVGQLDRGKSVPLAIIDGETLLQRNKGYVNSEEVLLKNSRIILYTDGLIETVNINDTKKIFQDSAMVVFLELHALAHREFIDSLYQSLVDFRGGDDFEDDVCVVCVDIIH